MDGRSESTTITRLVGFDWSLTGRHRLGIDAQQGGIIKPVRALTVQSV